MFPRWGIGFTEAGYWVYGGYSGVEGGGGVIPI